MAAKPSLIDRRAALVDKELNSRTDRLAKVLEDELSSDDATTQTEAEFHDTVRRNWDNPAWRAQVAQRMGPTELYRTAIKAFGLPDPHKPGADLSGMPGVAPVLGPTSSSRGPQPTSASSGDSGQALPGMVGPPPPPPGGAGLFPVTPLK